MARKFLLAHIKDIPNKVIVSKRGISSPSLEGLDKTVIPFSTTEGRR
jgi:hypothetical protein